MSDTASLKEALNNSHVTNALRPYVKNADLEDFTRRLLFFGFFQAFLQVMVPAEVGFFNGILYS
jgi:hypothetical protein